MAPGLQRNNFRCPRDGSMSPLVAASLSAGAAAMGGVVASGGSGFRAEFPARQRKRLQVGATNLSKCNSLTEVAMPPVVDPAPTPNVSVALHKLCESNLTLVKASMQSPQRNQPRKRRSVGGEVKPLVLRTEFRRLRALTPATSRSEGGHMVESQGTPSRLLHSSDGTRPLQPLETSPEIPMPLNETRFEANGPVGGSKDEQLPSISDVDMKATTQEARKDKQQTILARNRAKLYDVFVEKYGSMRAVFRAFDNDGNGMISAQRFQDMVEASEVDLSPDETRALYQSADTNGDNTVAFQEFVQLFAPAADAVAAAAAATELASSAYSPVKDPAGPTRDPSSSLALKYRTPLDLSPRSRRRMQQLRKQVTDELGRKHGLALGVHGGKPEQLLAYAFKNVDGDNDGFLSYDEVEHALGRGFLQLDDAIPPADMREMLQLMDRNGDAQISLREFVHYFAAGERDPPTDLLDNARKKELAALHLKRTAELTPRDEVDPAFASRRRASQILESNTRLSGDRQISTPPTSGCLPEQLAHRLAATFQACELSSMISQADNDRGDSKTSPSLEDSLQHRRPTTSMVEGPVVAVLTPVSPDRFQHRRHERTDWSRVGIGGDGTRIDSALYQSTQERFRTTSGEAYSPLSRAPPSATSTDDVFAMTRSGKPTATLEEDARRVLRAARHSRTQRLVQEHERMRAQEVRLKDWKARCNARKGAGERFCYLDRLQDREQQVAAKEEHMQRRHGGASFLRMWAGSSESQFNLHHGT